MKIVYSIVLLVSITPYVSSIPSARRFEKVQNVFTSSRINPVDVHPQLFQTSDGRLFALRSPPSQKNILSSNDKLYQTQDGRIIRINEGGSSILANEDWNSDLEVTRGLTLNEEQEEDWTNDPIEEDLRESTLQRAENLFTPFVVNDNAFQGVNEGQRFKIVRNENFRIPARQGLRVIDDNASRIRNDNLKDNSRLLSIQNQRPLRVRLLGNSNGGSNRQQVIRSPNYSLSEDTATGYFAFPSAGISYRYK